MVTGGESTSAQLRQALRERDEAVRVALDNRAELVAAQKAFAASQADLTAALEQREELAEKVRQWKVALAATREGRDQAVAMLRAELVSAQAELKLRRAS
jgi:hypothetical protein